MKACKHPTCGPICRRPKKEKKQSYLRRVPIKRVSVKRKEQNKIYSFKRKLFLAANPFCEIKSPDCTYTAPVIHHKKGREGDLFLDETFWAASCESCNIYVEINDAWAREHGHKLSKHQKAR
jgi:hypothetical protein